MLVGSDCALKLRSAWGDPLGVCEGPGRTAIVLVSALVAAGCSPALTTTQVPPVNTRAASPTHLQAGTPQATSTHRYERVTTWRTGGRVAPLVDAGRILSHSWAEQGQVLPYWTWSEEELQLVDPYPPGKLHFLEAEASEVCDSPVDVGYPYFVGTLVWTREGDVVTATRDGRIARFTPCEVGVPPRFYDVNEPALAVYGPLPERLLVRNPNGEIGPFSLDTSMEWVWFFTSTASFGLDLDRGNVVPLPGAPYGGPYSPNGTKVALTEDVAGSTNINRTSIVELDTDQELGSVRWEYQPAMDMVTPTLWLNDQELLIYRQIIGGPVILNLQGEAVHVDSELIGRDCLQRMCYAFAATAGAGPDYHIAVQDPDLDLPAPWLLYHSHDGTVEELQTLGWIWFSPDGGSLAGHFQEGSSGEMLWTRRVDPYGSPPVVFEPGLPRDGSGGPATWSGDSSMIAFAVEEGIAVARLEPGRALTIWSTGEYSPTPTLWSPDSRYLIVIGNIVSPSANEQAGLFLLQPR